MLDGLEMARTYFEEWGLELLRKEYPSLVDRVAAGIWRGSQIFGADDELSRDHGWGGYVTLILTDEDFQKHGEALANAVRENAPREWKGCRRMGGDQVVPLDGFFEGAVGSAVPFANPDEWLRGFRFRFGTRETELYLIRHGPLFYDPLGEFSARRELFRFYPEPVRLTRINEELLGVWHYGQYNFVDRVSRRGDPVARAMALGHFSEAVMRLCMLLDKDYAPYWKWLAFEFRKHRAAAVLDPLLTELCASRDVPRQVDLVTEICRFVHGLLAEHGLAASDLSFHPHSFMCDLEKGPLSEYARWTT